MSAVAKIKLVSEKKAALAHQLLSEKKYTESKELYLQAAEGIHPYIKSDTNLKKKCLEWITLAEKAKLLQGQSESSKSSGNFIDLLVGEVFDFNTKEKDIEILEKSSLINGKVFVPWRIGDATFELSQGELFTDPDGKLILSDLQTQRFHTWRRVGDIFGEKISMFSCLSTDNIVQDLITNCSFVASLCICASYETRFKKRLITAAIHPNDSVSKSGKYVVKLFVNGIYRKVVIDDYLPVSNTGTLLCTKSKKIGEVWPSLIEKAFMKLSGGYAFLGSNSSIDLHSLTGWIPEQIFFQSKTFVSESVWKRLFEGYDRGYVVATIGTGKLSESLEVQLGLVTSHAYAVLDVREVQGLRLLKIKNPWGHFRWKGLFSHLDEKSWTQELKRKLSYNPKNALEVDDGIFWIDYNSVCKTFETFNFNWNPEYFPFTFVLHSQWSSSEVPHQYYLGFNPQFSLEIKSTGDVPSIVWLLLTKHTTSMKENNDYLAVHVYKNKPPFKDIRVHTIGAPLIQGVYVNSTHILTKFTAPAGITNYTILLAQKDGFVKHNFTLHAFSMSSFHLEELPVFSHVQKISGKWEEDSSGGNLASLEFYSNPQFAIEVTDGPLTLVLASSQTTPVGFVVFGQHQKIIGKTEVYKIGLVSQTFPTILAGKYTIIPTTYEEGKCGNFTLSVLSNSPANLRAAPSKNEGMLKTLWKGNCNDLVEFSLVIKRITQARIKLVTQNLVQAQVDILISTKLITTSGLSHNKVTYLSCVLEPQTSTASITKALSKSFKPQEYFIRIKTLHPTFCHLCISHDHEVELKQV